MNIDLSGPQRLIEIDEELERLDGRSADLKKEREELEARLLEQFGQQGVSKVSLNDKTVYMHRQTWAGVVDGRKEDLHAALRDVGAGDLVKESVNMNSLSALVREYPKDEAGAPVLPAPLVGLVRVTERYSLRIRRA